MPGFGEIFEEWERLNSDAEKAARKRAQKPGPGKLANPRRVSEAEAEAAAEAARAAAEKAARKGGAPAAGPALPGSPRSPGRADTHGCGPARGTGSTRRDIPNRPR